MIVWANSHRRGIGHYRMCRGKVRYRTLRAARWQAAERRKVSGETAIAPYPCRYCRAYHIGHGDGTGPARRKPHYFE